jgi:hypothetical protein
MAKTVTIGKQKVKHLQVGSGRCKSPLCGAVDPKPTNEESPRTAGYGEVTCTSCKRVLKQIAVHGVATKS